MMEIYLTQNKVTIVSDEDHEYLMSLASWHVRKQDSGNFYAVNNGNWMHNVVASRMFGSLDGYKVDHIDHDTLNNQRSNLRLCTHSQQMANRRKLTPGKSKYKGVTFHNATGKWVARIMVNKKSHSLGYFSVEEDAAKAYNEAALKHFGEFACTESLVNG